MGLLWGLKNGARGRSAVHWGWTGRPAGLFPAEIGDREEQLSPDLGADPPLFPVAVSPMSDAFSEVAWCCGGAGTTALTEGRASERVPGATPHPPGQADPLFAAPPARSLLYSRRQSAGSLSLGSPSWGVARTPDRGPLGRISSNAFY